MTTTAKTNSNTYMHLRRPSYAEADLPAYFKRPTAEEQDAFNASVAMLQAKAGIKAELVSTQPKLAPLAQVLPPGASPGNTLPIGQEQEAVTAQPARACIAKNKEKNSENMHIVDNYLIELTNS